MRTQPIIRVWQISLLTYDYKLKIRQRETGSLAVCLHCNLSIVSVPADMLPVLARILRLPQGDSIDLM